MSNFTIVEKKYGKLLLCDDDNLIENYIRNNEQIWDEDIVNEIEKHINSESVVIDVGAYIGEQVIHLSKKCKHIHAFEPQLRRFQQMCGNLCINECYNVTCYNVGACEKEKNIQITHPCENNDADGRLHEGGTVKCIPLDHFNLNPNLIKIDAQGYDYFVIEGAKETIKEHKPIIIFEFEPFFSKNIEDYKILFNELNYTVDSISSNSANYIAKSR
jgi:FkbM family methyltransferase